MIKINSVLSGSLNMYFTCNVNPIIFSTTLLDGAAGMKHLGGANDQIATTSCTRVSVTRLMQRFRQTVDRPRIGWPRLTTPNGGQHLRSRVLSVTSSVATALGHDLSRQTVSEDIPAAGTGVDCPLGGIYKVATNGFDVTVMVRFRVATLVQLVGIGLYVLMVEDSGLQRWYRLTTTEHILKISH